MSRLSPFVLAALLAAPAAVRAGPSPVLGFPERKGAIEKSLKKIALWLPNGKQLLVEVADTPEDRERGLMFRRKLPKDYGMLFVFPEPIALRFWMKNTFVSLDIVYLGPDKAITRVHHRVAPSTAKTPEDEIVRVGGWGQFVLELPAGAAEKNKLSPGQVMKFSAIIPDK